MYRKKYKTVRIVLSHTLANIIAVSVKHAINYRSCDLHVYRSCDLHVYGSCDLHVISPGSE